MTSPDETAWALAREEFAALFTKAAQVVTAELERSRVELAGEPSLTDEAVVEWKAKLRRLLHADPTAATSLAQVLERVGTATPQGATYNAITGNVTGTAVQAHTIHGGVSNTRYGGDHVHFSHGTFQGTVSGSTTEHHYDSTRMEQTGASAAQDVIAVHNNDQDQDRGRGSEEKD